VFNAGPPRAPHIYRDAANLIGGEFGLEIAPVVLPERAAFHHSVAAGLTAPEQDVQGKAAGEIWALWAWTCEQLGMSTRALAVPA
jgi:chromosome partitioning protein